VGRKGIWQERAEWEFGNWELVVVIVIANYQLPITNYQLSITSPLLIRPHQLVAPRHVTFHAGEQFGTGRLAEIG
jgi:hypothetical protein